jgi:hypothetical protein
LIVSASEVVCFSDPLTPTTVMVEVPGLAVLLTEMYRVVDPVIGDAPNQATTPFGHPLWPSETEPVKPFDGTTEMVDVTRVPGAVVALAVLDVNAKSALVDTGVVVVVVVVVGGVVVVVVVVVVPLPMVSAIDVVCLSVPLDPAMVIVALPGFAVLPTEM